MSDAMDKLNEEMAKIVRPLSPPTSTNNLISERAKTHGDYEQQTFVTQQLKQVMRRNSNHDKFSDIQRESLEMIALKIGRILAGDPDFRDHWDDIAGYAKLVADRSTK